MKTLLFFLFVTSISAHAACDKKVDNSKVILFIDTNDSDMEIATAEKAACARGERVVVVPKNYKEYNKYTKEIKKHLDASSRCERDGNQSERCGEVQSKIATAYAELEKFMMTKPSLQEALKTTLEELKKGKAKIQSLVVSGHDGGGMYGGYKGSLDKHSIGSAFNGHESINDIKSILLLGCYTGVQKEVGDWKGLFPDAKLIAGYDDSAPLSTRPQGHKYLSELLLKEKELFKQTDEKKLQSFARANLSSMFSLSSAVYLQCKDKDEEKEFYYGSKKPERKFATLQMDACENRVAIDSLKQKVAAYMSGELEIPADTARGELRQLYIRARSLEHCFDANYPEVNVHHVFNLLFYEGVKKSFANYYKDDLEKAEKEVAGITLENIEAMLKSKMADSAAEKKIYEDFAELARKTPQELVGTLESKLAENKKQLEELQASPEYRAMSQVRDYNAFTAAQLDLQKKFLKLSVSVPEYEDYIRRAKLDPSAMATAFDRNAQYKQEEVSNIERKYTNIRSDWNNLKVWVPTAKNLATKSRKETLKNNHSINLLLGANILTSKQTTALRWVNRVTEQHLEHFANPFSWHEFTGSSVERPQQPITYPN